MSSIPKGLFIDHPKELLASNLKHVDVRVLAAHTPPPTTTFPNFFICSTSKKPPFLQKPRSGLPAPHAPGDAIFHARFVSAAPAHQPVVNNIAV